MLSLEMRKIISGVRIVPPLSRLYLNELQKWVQLVLAVLQGIDLSYECPFSALTSLYLVKFTMTT